jgi:cytochrome b subunit of formate dehydrogenase
MLYVGWSLWRRRRTTGKGLIACFLDLPMVMRPSDLKHVLHLLAYLLFLRQDRPQSGRFNPEEKFEYFGVFWGVVVLGVTGLFMWANAWASRYVPGRVLTIAMLLHTFEAFLALVHVGVVHIIGVTLSPGVFPLSPAMFTGKTPPDEMAEGHSAMIDDAQARLASAATTTQVKHE